MSSVSQTRRSFLKMLGIAGGGLVLGVPMTGCASAPVPYQKSDAFQPNAFLQITSDNRITFFLPRVEMGQGTAMGLATLIAEELEVDPADIHIRHAGVHSDYINPDFKMQGTGGSTSMKVSYYPLREAAATAREILRSAAAQQLGAPRDTIAIRNGQLHWQDKHFPYGEFAKLAATLPVPAQVAVKAPGDFRLIGKPQGPRVDALAKVTGTAEFGIDVQLPELYKAALKRCPVIGGKVKRVDTTAAEQMPGVKKVVTIFNGVATIADTYWQARKALEQVQVEWELPELSQHSSDAIYTDFKTGLDTGAGEEACKQGEGIEALAAAAKTLEADYRVPYLAHATMEPMNCTVKIDSGRVDVWAPTQMPDIARVIAEEYSGIDRDNIAVHTTFLGGGFGRRVNQDYIAEAVSIAKVSGLAVQLVWSREDDIRNDFYRPAAMARFQAGIDSDGKLQTWSVKRAGPNIMPYTIDEAAGAVLPEFMPDGLVEWISKRGYGIFDGWTVDPSSVEGLWEDYDVPNKEVRHVTVDPGLRVGFWRSVGHSFSGFFKESFMDEVAHAAGQDPVQFRLLHTQHNPRLLQVLETAAKQANWGKPSAPHHFQGVAVHYSFNTYVAQVAEVSVENGMIKVHKVTCAVDCGRAVNPDIVKAQMESGIVFGLTAALHGKITLQDGAVQQSNFHDYPMLRMSESPAIDVHIVDSEEDPTGVGEPGLPPIAAAIGNAVFAATGQRLRQLPLALA